MSNETRIPGTDMGRAISLADFDLDYSDTQDIFRDLTKLAASIAGTETALITLIDLYTQWTVAYSGISIPQFTKDNAVCRFTLATPEPHFEVKDLAADARFNKEPYVCGEPYLRYYLGIPLENEAKQRLGTLCLLDTNAASIGEDKIALLGIIAGEIVHRLTDLHLIHVLRNKVKESKEIQKKVAHDIRGPLSGIVNLAHLIAEQGEENKIEEVLEVINMIHTSGNSLLEFADEILTPSQQVNGQDKMLQSHELNLQLLKDKLQKLYSPQAIHKRLAFSVDTHPDAADTVPFAKNKLLQIIGNLVSNAIKFTPEGGNVTVNLHLVQGSTINKLIIVVSDSGVGLAQDQINYILKGTSASTEGTDGEHGYGYGLSLVKNLVDSMNGTIDIRSAVGAGTSFELILPVSRF